MQEKIKRLEQLTSKKAKTTNDNAAFASDLLFEIFTENKDMNFLCENLYASSYVVAEPFAIKFYFRLAEVDKINLFSGLMSAARDKQHQVIFPVCFSIIASVVKQQSTDTFYHKLLKYLFKLADTNEGFSETKCKMFKDHLLQKSNGTIFDTDYSQWSKPDIQRFFRYLNTAIKDISSLPYKTKLEKWFDKNGLPAIVNPSEAVIKDETKPQQQEVVSPKPMTAPEIAEQKPDELLKTVDAVKSEMQKLFANAFEKNNAFRQLEDSIKSKETEIAQLKTKLEEATKTLHAQVAQIESLQDEISRKTTEIAKLNYRLKLSYSADEISKNQELDALKKDIGEAIKLQYTDFSENKNAACTEDNYEALKVSLNQIFRALKRHGVEF